MILDTPFGNKLTLDMAYAAIEGEKLGMGPETDFLSISFSPTDVIGHRFGPSSIEIEDTYLRLDREIENFLNYLDQTFGNEYLLFLTSDHGVAELPDLYLNGAGKVSYPKLIAQLYNFTNERYGKPYDIRGLFIKCALLSVLIILSYFLLSFIPHKPQRMYSRSAVIFLLISLMVFLTVREYNFYRISKTGWISHISNEQIYINHKLVIEKGENLKKIQDDLVQYTATIDGIKEAYSAPQIANMGNQSGHQKMLFDGFNPEISGDVAFLLEPGWIPIYWPGTTHGYGYTYDSHVPLIFFGWNIPQGQSSSYHPITDLVPTLSKLLNISPPDGASGNIIPLP